MSTSDDAAKADDALEAELIHRMHSLQAQLTETDIYAEQRPIAEALGEIFRRYADVSQRRRQRAGLR